jgi:hypothetical protein
MLRPYVFYNTRMARREIAQPRPIDIAKPAGLLTMEFAALRSPVLWLVASLLFLWLLIVPQLPLRYSIDVGYEEGYGSDLPLLQGFNTAERDDLGTYRWTADGAMLVAPGIGERPLVMSFSFFPTGVETLTVGPQATELWLRGQVFASLPIRAEGRVHRVFVPQELLADGDLQVTIKTATFSPPGDERQLGARLGAIELLGLRDGWAMPRWTALWGWLAVLILGRVLSWNGRGKREQAIANGVLIVGAILIGLAAWLDPPRWAEGASPAFVALALAYALTIFLRIGLPVLATRLDLPASPGTIGWLSIVSGASFALRFGGRLYPNAMHGDIGWHTNRMTEALLGQIYILSHNRGIDFPYPPGPYLLVAPFTLPGISLPLALQLGAALVDSLSAVLIYGLCVRALGQRTALLAAGTYVFTAATFMTSWWSFDTHIYTQFFALLAVCTLSLMGSWKRLGQGRGGAEAIAFVGLAFALVFLGHFGFLLNMALLGGLLLAWIWLASWQGAAWAKALRWKLTLGYGGALLVAGIFFYSAYLGLFIGQAQTAATGGVAGLANREPIARSVLWEQLWHKGLIAHFGFFPVALALVQFWSLSRGAVSGGTLRPRGVLFGLMIGSFAISACFAILPFITQVNSSTRWLMFSAWAVAVGAALGWRRLWRSGRGGQLIALVTAAYVLWNTALYWLGPMLYRIRPPEPF